MKRVRFYGASDDLIEVDGDVPGCDEYPGEHGVFEVAGLRVGVDYDGCWGITVRQIDEDVPVTAKVTAVRPHRHSMLLTLVVPDGAYVSKVSQ